MKVQQDVSANGHQLTLQEPARVSASTHRNRNTSQLPTCAAAAALAPLDTVTVDRLLTERIWGKTTGRHRLNRGGNRQANNALWRIVIGRLRWHHPTRDYVTRRTAEGLSKKEIIRCLKRYVAREVFRVIVAERELARAA